MSGLSSWILAAVCLISGLLLLGLAWEMAQILRAAVPTIPRTVHAGQRQERLLNQAAVIPKVIWTYWHQAPVPEFIAQCHANWQRFAPDHELRVVYQNTLNLWLDAQVITEQFNQLPPFRQADWLRLQLLAQHGGIWMDASTLLSQNLDWVHALQAEQGSEYVGFYIDRFTTRPDLPMVENWFMAAVAQSPFIKALVTEFEQALRMGEVNYLALLDAQGQRENAVQGLDLQYQNYLIMHVAASALLDRMPQAYHLALVRAEDSALGFHAALKWRKRHLYARLAMTPCPRQLPCLIKLRGGDRHVFERGLERGWFYHGSALAQLLNANRAP